MKQSPLDFVILEQPLMESYQAHILEERSKLFFNKLREGYEEWTKIKDKLLLFPANFLVFKPEDVSLTTDRIYKKNYSST